MTRTATRLTAGLVAAAAVLAAGAAPANALPRPAAVGHHAERGRLVSATHLKTMTAAEVRTWLASEKFDAASVRYGVDTYRLVCRTIDTRGRATTASGLLVLPRSGERRLRTVSYTHGTEIYKGDAPSTSDDVWGPGPAVTYAAAGFAAVAPDYLGLGEGPGAHPWKHVPSETSAALDMLRAARQYAPRRGRALDGDVLVTGFSQGASSALGLARALQGGADPRFRLRAVAPVSGAYDFGGAERRAVLDGGMPEEYAVVYVSYMFVSWNRVHGGMYRTPSDVFREPYASRVEKLFDSTTPGSVVVESLPRSLGELLTEDGMDALRHPSGTFAAALREDAEVCTAWTPRVPIRLYKISEDEQAVTANADRCAAWFAERGVRVPIIDVGDTVHEGSRHLGSNIAGTARIVRWFSALR
ncbi:lipase [Actinomadura decatromicini]|uniref:Lipase n=1 Tax=Actinomadura decatromicini TaxID=2604572 RepID=A0A5D3FBZ3_9ACTN|nr:lipase [Actinomadura decatromicini]TYK45414.1 lipase [Actinomadura decatromicini]